MVNGRAAYTYLGLGRLFSLDFFFGCDLNENKDKNEVYQQQDGMAHGSRSRSLRCGLDGGSNLGWLVLGLGSSGGSGLLRHYALERTVRRGSHKDGWLERDLHVWVLKQREREGCRRGDG